MKIFMIQNFLIAKLRTIEDVEVPPKNEIKPCLAACETHLYSLLITNANYPSHVTYRYTRGFCIVVKKLLQSLENKRRSLNLSHPRLIELLEELNVKRMGKGQPKLSWYCVQLSSAFNAL